MPRPPDRSALDACLQGSLGLGELTELGQSAEAATCGEEDPELPRPSKSARRGGHARGFNIHAGVVIGSNDRNGRERLLRYCSRSPLSLQRLSVLPDGRVAYALRRPWGKQTHRVMEPLQFMARLAALVPPPRHKLIRFHGVFAPHSAWRSRVVPRPTPEHDPKSATDTSVGCSCLPTNTDMSADAEPSAHITNSSVDSVSSLCFKPSSRNTGNNAVCKASAALISITTDNNSSICDRGPVHAAAGALCSATNACIAAPLRPSHDASPSAKDNRSPRLSARIDWAELLKRTYDIDALACPCGGRLRFISVITERDVASAILESLGLPSDPPPIARARAPNLTDPIPDYW